MVRCLYCGEYLPLEDERTVSIYESAGTIPIRPRRYGSYGGFATKKRKTKQKTGLDVDLSIFNEDGSLNLYKCLAAFAMIDGLLLLMMLSILLLLM